MTRLLEPPEGRQVFTLAFTPTDRDIDANGHVNNVVYLGWVQDIAIAHWESRAPLEEQGKWAWILAGRFMPIPLPIHNKLCQK